MEVRLAPMMTQWAPHNGPVDSHSIPQAVQVGRVVVRWRPMGVWWIPMDVQSDPWGLVGHHSSGAEQIYLKILYNPGGSGGAPRAPRGAS